MPRPAPVTIALRPASIFFSRCTRGAADDESQDGACKHGATGEPNAEPPQMTFDT